MEAVSLANASAKLVGKVKFVEYEINKFINVCQLVLIMATMLLKMVHVYVIVIGVEMTVLKLYAA